MNSVLVMVLLVALALVTGFWLGYIERDTRDMIENFVKRKPTPEPPKVGPTLGSYRNPEVKPKPTIHIINPKTPARIAYEAEMAQLEEARKGKVPMGPK